MREIKFRAWDGKKMHPAFDLSQNPKYWWEDNKDYPLMQFTGLKDKNGKEIYEGDILRRDNQHSKTGYDPYPYVLDTFENGGFWASHRTKSQPEPYIISGLVIGSQNKQFEVIGNIYENPELLK